jgi:hypothetical protein
MYETSAVGGMIKALTALPTGGAVAVVGEERSRAVFIDGRGAARGSFRLGQPTESPIAVLADGTALIVGFGGRDLYLVDPRGRYLGGLALADPIVAGPFAATGDQLVVETETEILVLSRVRR